MSYAIRNDGLGWRAVNNSADVATGETYSVSQPTQSLAMAKMMQSATIDASFQSSISQPIAYMGTTFQADKDSRDLMAQAITGLQAVVAVGGSVPASFAWWDANNNPVPMTLMQLQGLYATGMLAYNVAFANKRIKKDAITAATDMATVNAINW